METQLKILAGIGTLVVIAIVAVMFMTTGMSDTADKFFTSVKADNLDEAYSFLSDTPGQVVTLSLNSNYPVGRNSLVVVPTPGCGGRLK